MQEFKEPQIIAACLSDLDFMIPDIPVSSSLGDTPLLPFSELASVLPSV